MLTGAGSSTLGAEGCGGAISEADGTGFGETETFLVVTLLVALLTYEAEG